MQQHLYNIESLSRFLDKPIIRASKKDLRKFLKKYKEDYSKSCFANKIKTLRAFYGRFLQSDLANSFKIPQPQTNDNHVPDKEDLQKFYKHIDGRAEEKYRALFLIKATSGLRTGELANLTMENVTLEKNMIEPNHNSSTKRSYISFYNSEAKKALKRFLPVRKEGDERLFQVGNSRIQRKFRKVSKKSGIKITPKMLRKWFTKQMQKAKVAGEYIDAFCGRLPKTIRAQHYTDFSSGRLKEVYEKADLRVLE